MANLATPAAEPYSFQADTKARLPASFPRPSRAALASPFSLNFVGPDRRAALVPRVARHGQASLTRAARIQAESAVQAVPCPDGPLWACVLWLDGCGEWGKQAEWALGRSPSPLVAGAGALSFLCTTTGKEEKEEPKWRPTPKISKLTNVHPPFLRTSLLPQRVLKTLRRLWHSPRSDYEPTGPSKKRSRIWIWKRTKTSWRFSL